jgi:hypothetical protein
MYVTYLYPPGGGSPSNPGPLAQDERRSQPAHHRTGWDDQPSAWRGLDHKPYLPSKKTPLGMQILKNVIKTVILMGS